MKFTENCEQSTPSLPLIQGDTPLASRERNFAAFEALEARRDVILAFHRLNVPTILNMMFLSTNHIENVMGNARGTIGRICRWHVETNQVARWMAVALLRAQSGFRRISGHKQTRRAGSLAGPPLSAVCG